MNASAPDHETNPIAPGVALRSDAMRFTFSRASGPGGQNVNKVNTRATLTLPLSALEEAVPAWAMARLREIAGRYLADNPERLVIHAANRRSQLANRRACVLKLRGLLVQAMNRPRVRRKTRPSKAARQRRLDNKKHRSQLKARRRPPEH